MSEFAKRVVLALLRAYKWALSPMLGPACRYVPSCSDYAADAVAHYGVLCGSAMAIWRLLRCHPFARGGFDPAIPGAGNQAAGRNGTSGAGAQTLGVTGR